MARGAVRDTIRSAARGLACAAFALLVLAGCSNDVKLRKAELQQLATLLPGKYDNREQAEAGSGAGDAALELNLVQIYAPFLSDYVFYVQENALGDPRRVLAQRLFVFDLVDEKRIVQRTLGFAEPMRWRDGHQNTDLFKGMMGQDVGAAAGACVLEWSLGTEFFAGKAASPATCVGPARAELTGRGLTLAEPELRFLRRAR